MDFDRICELRTPATVRCLAMDDHRGAPVVVVVAKLGFRVSPRGAASLSRVPVRITSMGWGERGSLRSASDWAAQKPGTDVVMIATAHPPPEASAAGIAGSAPVPGSARDVRPSPPRDGGQPPARVTEMDVSLRVGLLQKTLRVYGQRVYYQGVIGVVPGPPARLEPTPLQYENAYGGRDAFDRHGVGYDPRNPVGIGFAHDRARLVGSVAPAIEDPSVAMPSRLTTPAGFGPIPADWEPRLRFAGTFDERWARERAPVAPTDHDPRHASFAPAGLWSQKPLIGDEPVEVLGATPEGAWRFRLPRYEPVFACTIRGERRELETHLDTFYVDVEERRVELTWRAVITLPRKRELVERIEMSGKDRLPETLFTDAGYQPPALEASA
jgi:hypothetical protein